MKRKIFRLLAFAGMVALLAAGLKFMNWLPQVAQKEIMRKYGNVEEVKAALAIRDIYIPVYFPQNLTWPPSLVLAQGKPFPAVVMEFETAAGKEPALIISQSTSDGFLPDEKIRIVQVKERLFYQLKGRNALLDVGVCGRNEPCSAISWREGEFRLRVLAKTGPIDLIRIAESMIR